MKRIYNLSDVDELLNRFGMPELFDCGALSFYAAVYEPNERISGPGEQKSDLRFLRGSEVRIYELWEDGSRMLVEMPQTDLLVLGEIELFSGRESRYYIEAVKRTEVLCLPIEPHRAELMNNPQFLCFLLQSLTEKLELGRDNYPLRSRPLREQILGLMKASYPDHILPSVGQAAERLGCSSRQIYRVLNQLEEEGLIEKPQRGLYRLK